MVCKYKLTSSSSWGGAPVPVSGALAVEVGVYLLIPFMAYSKNAAWLGMIISLILNFKMGLNVDTFAPRYSEFLTGYFAFTIGSLINHYKNELIVFSKPRLSIAIWLLHCLVIIGISTWPWTYGLYISVILSAWVVISLYQVKSSKFDTILGDLSYPIYLLHTTVGAWFIYSVGSDRNLIFFIVSFIVTVILSYILLIIFDHPIQKLKKRVKNISTKDKEVDEFVVEIIFKIKKIISHKIAFILLVFIGILFTLSTLFITYKIINNNNLKVYAWGPNITQVNTIPNIQPNGDAGLWIKTSLTKGLGNLTVYVNNKPIETTVSFELITASIPKEYFNDENKLNITIRSDKNYNFKVGILFVSKEGVHNVRE